MSRNKYSKEFKVNIVKRYLNGDSPVKLAQEYGMGKQGRRLIHRWFHLYELHGEYGFDSKERNSSYSKEFKLKIINEYLSGSLSYEQIGAKYKLAYSVVQRWVHKYNKGVEIKDYKLNKEVYTMKSRKVSKEEKLKIINYVIENNNNIKEAATTFKVPYANVYQWVKKYLKEGTTSLEDRRGRPRKDESLSTLDSKDKEIIRLKKELELKDLAIKVLKKNEEIRKQMDSRSFNKKTNTKQ